jgi:DNA/RNA-binding domain of Phe-tRNA-synthetase-like protein
LNLEGLPVFCDAAGPHGSPTSDSERTMVTLETKKVIAIIISFGGADTLPRWGQQMMDALQKQASGKNIQLEIVK